MNVVPLMFLLFVYVPSVMTVLSAKSNLKEMLQLSPEMRALEMLPPIGMETVEAPVKSHVAYVPEFHVFVLFQYTEPPVRDAVTDTVTVVFAVIPSSV